MKRRRIRVFVSVLAVVGAAIGVACTFPDVEFSPVTAGEGGASEGGAESSTDAPSDVAFDVPVLIDGGDPDALIEKDAGMKVDASGCMPTDCDCDHDTFHDLTKNACQDAGGANDCDDNDTRYRPDQGWVIDKPEAPHVGDWNCMNGVEKLYKPNINCSSLGFGATCDATYGFTDNPSCGFTGTFVQCKSVGTPPLNLDGKCVAGPPNLTTIQACK